MLKRYWIIALVSLLLLAGFASTLLTSYFVAYKSLGEEISQNTLPLTSDNIYSEIQKDLVLSIHISSLMAHDTFVRDWIIAGEQNPERIIRYLQQIQEKYETITAFFVSQESKNYYHPDGILKKVSKDDPDDKWYFRASRMQSPYEINIDTDTADQSRMTIFINYQVYGYDNDLLGVTGVGLELKQVQDILQTYQDKYKSSVFFVNNSGKVTLRADDFQFPEDIHNWKNFSHRALSILTNPGVSFEYKADDHVFYVSSRFIPEFNLFLIILKNSDSLRERLTARLKFNFAIGLFITLTVVVIVGTVLRKYNRSLERLASIDTLTGAYNRHAFSMIFSQMVKESKRKEYPVSLILFDIDYFKSINDQLGHHSGDLALKKFSRIVSETIRESDVLCRWGGEEFAVLLRECPLEEAVNIAEKIRKDIAGHEMYFGKESVSMTVSAGVVRRRPGEYLSTLTERADKLMYQAKQEGRNRVVSEKHA